VNILKRVMHSNDFAILKGLAAQLVRWPFIQVQLSFIYTHTCMNYLKFYVGIEFSCMPKVWLLANVQMYFVHDVKCSNFIPDNKIHNLKKMNRPYS
jgi:hypothetical protein